MSSSVVSPYLLLLVDNNPPRRKAIAALLQGLGFGVTCASSVEEGHAVTTQAKVDAVISISNPEPLRGGPHRESARPVVAIAVTPAEDAPASPTEGIIRLPLRAPDLVRAIRVGLDRLRDS